MEKYRRWTDERAGINPFVQAKKESTPLTGKILKTLALLPKVILLLISIIAFILLQLIPIHYFKQLNLRFILYLFGVYSIEDYSVGKNDKSGSITRILSNHCCFIDILYYLYRYPGFSFVGFSQDQKGDATYFVVSPFKAFFLAFTSLQPFYRNNSRGKYGNLEELVKEHQKTGLIIFYQKIRTNGKGTIRIQKNLCDELYSLGQNYLILQMKYTPRKTQLFTLTTSGLRVMLNILGTVTPGNNLKIRASRQNSTDTHSSKQLNEAVDMMATGPLLQTQAGSFFQFRNFYGKTQNEGYKLE